MVVEGGERERITPWTRAEAEEAVSSMTESWVSCSTVYTLLAQSVTWRGKKHLPISV